MGCAQSKTKRGDVILPSAGKNDGLLSVPPAGSSASTVAHPSDSSLSSVNGVGPASTRLNQGTHWAEASPGKNRREAERPWDPKNMGAASIAEGDQECQECQVSGQSMATLSQRENNFAFNCTFPMMVMKMETFMKLKVMTCYEDLIATGEVFEWTPDMGRVFFLSHQWTSFSHPDPKSEQLKVAQSFLTKVAEGKIRSLFATEEEWLAFHYKESNRFLQFDPVTEEGIAADAKNGYVWLDYASVPQAAAAEEQRLRAIDSIPYYVDNALCFLAIVPKIEHKDLPGTFCTYKSWQERGWCRLETQVHELRLFIEKGGELMPGVPKLDLPRRPLIVHSGNYATTYDMMDNFYMIWQRKSSIFTGEFACCRLGHKRKGKDGEMINVTCDKTRIRPLVRALWERKIAHLATMPAMVRWLFHWRWASHTEIMMSDFAEDVEESTDPNLDTLEDVCDKYLIDEAHRQTYLGMMGMMGPMFFQHPSVNEPEDTPVSGGGGATFMPQMEAWFARWSKAAESLESYQVAWAVSYMVAEGNVRMLEKLHKHYGADLTLGYCWGITLLDFAAGKGHTRTIQYLAANGTMDVIDKPSFRERITAIDRACKAGFVDVLDLLVELGATLTPMRLNRQVPAHGAAIQGYTPVLKRLHELGADVVHAYDDAGKSPLDYAVYFCHKEASEFLRGLQDGKLTKWEEKRVVAAATKMQSRVRGEKSRRYVAVLRTARLEKRELTEEEKKALGAHM
jgi:hypothetical protein